MKTILITAIFLMIVLIGCNVEINADSKDLNYLNSFVILPFLSLAIYALFNLDEFENFLNKK